MKIGGVIMAGGKGTRLRPFTNIFNKHFIPIYDQPMIFYSISTLIRIGVKEIVIVCNDGDASIFKKILSKKEEKYKLNLYFKSQKNIGGGIAEGLIIAKKFIKKNDKTVFILGDNFFEGNLFLRNLKSCLNQKNDNSYIFLSKVSKPQDYGIAYFKDKQLTKIIEKPKNSSSKLAITGLYIFNKNVIGFINQLKISKRKELEISSINQLLLKKRLLDYRHLGKETAWYDLGTQENIEMCRLYLKKMKKRHNKK